MRTVQHSTIRHIIHTPLKSWLGILNDVGQTQRRQKVPPLRDELTNDGVSLAVPGGSLCGGPQLAWTVIWGGAYSNLIREYVPNDLQQSERVL